MAHSIGRALLLQLACCGYAPWVSGPYQEMGEAEPSGTHTEPERRSSNNSVMGACRRPHVDFALGSDR